MTATAPGTRTRSRRLLGLRRTPGRIALLVFRMPLRLYRHGAGWLLGHVFLQLVHVGRRTGAPHAAVAMVLGFDPRTRRAVICSGWGPNADWVLNLRAGPALRVDIGRDSFRPTHRFLGEEEAVEVCREFRDRHPHRVRLISRILGWGDLSTDERLRQFVAERPFVELRPSTGAPVT